MQTEIEAKFLHVNHDEVRANLKVLGAVCEHPMRLMRRAMFDYPDNRFQKAEPSQRLRVRDEGDKITVNHKASNESNYVFETETTVGSFDNMYKLFESIGLHCYSFQESKRETWQLGDVEVVLDEWPWLSTYIEIEGPTEESIKETAMKLGFDWKDAKFGSVDTAYMDEYPGMKKGDSVGDLNEVKFGDSVPQYFIVRRKK